MNAFRMLAAAVLALHGLVHLMGTAAYLKLAEVQGLPYKTTLLSGRLELGANGIAVFGVVWALIAAGFVVTAIAFIADWAWWPAALIGVTLLSLGVTLLDSSVAFAGVAVNLVILIGFVVATALRPNGWASVVGK
jgi:hypothetical protein